MEAKFSGFLKIIEFFVLLLGLYLGKCENFAMVKEDFSDYNAKEKREIKVYISYENRESCMIKVIGLKVVLGLGKYT